MTDDFGDEVAGIVGHRLLDLVRDQSDWSQQTFGSDSERGPIGALRHLEKEAREAQATPDDPFEYADCLLLVLDASRRAGWQIADLLTYADEKMKINKKRVWPESAGDDPVEHLKN